jgi:hypothetical protein
VRERERESWIRKASPRHARLEATCIPVVFNTVLALFFIVIF